MGIYRFTIVKVARTQSGFWLGVFNIGEGIIEMVNILGPKFGKHTPII